VEEIGRTARKKGEIKTNKCIKKITAKKIVQMVIMK
jgi:hypothetical protein